MRGPMDRILRARKHLRRAAMLLVVSLVVSTVVATSGQEAPVINLGVADFGGPAPATFVEPEQALEDQSRLLLMVTLTDEAKRILGPSRADSLAVGLLGPL